MKEIHTALASFQGAVGNIDLDAEVKVTTKAGGAYTFKYATLGAIRDAIRAPLKEAGLSVVQTIEADQFVTLVTHTSGQQITSTLPFKGVWQTAQEFGSLVTYYRRYGLVTTLGLVAAEDDDANIADQNTVEEKKEAPKKDFVNNRVNATEDDFMELKKIFTTVKLESKPRKNGSGNWYAGGNFWLTKAQHDELKNMQIMAAEPSKDELPFN